MDEPRWLDDDEQKAWRAYLQAMHLLTTQLERELQRDSSLSHPDYQILVNLSEAEGRRLRMSELASRTQSSRSRLTHAVARLEAAGWVTRESCPTDRRGLFAVLTDAGFAKLVAAAPAHVEGVRTHLFDQITPDQVVQLRVISQAMVDHLTPIVGDAPPA
ncbi:MAG TPA: MarR family transcriptional regulator [Acidimicrobiales bacterium]